MKVTIYAAVNQQVTYYVFFITSPITTHFFNGEACIEFRFFNRDPKVSACTDKTNYFLPVFNKNTLKRAVFGQVDS